MKPLRKILLVIAIIAVVFTLGNLIITIDKGITLTGYASDTGTANLTIASAASINFIVDSIDWGSGQVDEIPTSATINSEGTVTNGNWTAVSQGLTLQNDGNVDVSLTLTTSNVASAFIGGDSPSYKLKLTDNETGSCAAGNNSLSSYTEATGSAQTACTFFEFNNAKDLLNVDVELVIPEDALPGAKSSTITATATVI